ncbi:bifunctional DNA primase/polymerase [Pediococcus claussenii]|nr:bifunctional DNA primase/polymerase [Pediococcus claussenii]ANZ70083.1 hypothetical protein AYR57_07025 [Pediococcus claussenii]ANZ71898.1 hypothetical protein AYR58_07025 [Pediococcus claussenii]KRN18809.1 hypothetical protein IV79_GL000360 [Pediococcus claussenii]
MESKPFNRAKYLATTFGVKSYVTNPQTRAPYEEGYPANATNDIDKLEKMFSEHLNANVNINLKASDLLVLDVDRHEENKNGVHALSELTTKHGELPDTYWESTPHDGIHFFFKVPAGEELKAKVNFKNGLELINDQIIIAPSAGYKPTKDRDWTDIAVAPPWLIEMARVKRTTTISDNVKPFRKKALAYFIHDVVTAPQGNKSGRNSYLAKMIGKLLATGTDPQEAYDFTFNVLNQSFGGYPLQDKEVNRIFKSILKEEAKRRGVMSGKQNTSRNERPNE